MSTPKHRIALMIESDGPGGAESVFLNLANEYRAAGHEVFPVVHARGPGWVSSRLAENGFSVHRPSLSRPIDLAALRELTNWLGSNRITAIHAHEFTTCVYGSAAAKWLRIRSILTMHGGKAYTTALRRRIAMAGAARSADALVGVSADTANTLADALWLRRERVKVIPNGVNLRAGDRLGCRQTLGLAHDEYLLLAVGNLYPVKGHEVLIRAVKLLEAYTDLPTWRVAIAGRGDQEGALKQLIADCRVENKVWLLGLREDIPDLLAAADGFVMPSLSEGMPMAILEAMLAGLPLVCSSVGGIPSLLDHGRLGVLCPPGDPEALAAALLEVLRDRNAARSRAYSARVVAEKNYSASVMAAAYLSLLDI